MLMYSSLLLITYSTGTRIVVTVKRDNNVIIPAVQFVDHPRPRRLVKLLQNSFVSKSVTMQMAPVPKNPSHYEAVGRATDECIVAVVFTATWDFFLIHLFLSLSKFSGCIVCV